MEDEQVLLKKIAEIAGKINQEKNRKKIQRGYTYSNATKYAKSSSWNTSAPFFQSVRLSSSSYVPFSSPLSHFLYSQPKSNTWVSKQNLNNSRSTQLPVNPNVKSQATKSQNETPVMKQYNQLPSSIPETNTAPNQNVPSTTTNFEHRGANKIIRRISGNQKLFFSLFFCQSQV